MKVHVLKGDIYAAVEAEVIETGIKYRYIHNPMYEDGILFYLPESDELVIGYPSGHTHYIHTIQEDVEIL